MRFGAVIPYAAEREFADLAAVAAAGSSSDRCGERGGSPALPAPPGTSQPVREPASRLE